MRVLGIINQNAGHFRKKDLDEILEITKHTDTEIFATLSVDQAEHFLQEHHDFNPDILLIGGGDATFGETITKAKKCLDNFPARVGFLDFGTQNNGAVIANANDYWWDRILQRCNIGKPKAIDLVKYIVETDLENLVTTDLTLHQTNGRFASNSGFGLPSRLIWHYDLGSVEQYQRIIQTGELPKIKRNGITNHGLYRGLRTMLAGIASGWGLSKKMERFFAEAMDADVYLDGEKIEEGAKGILTSAYPHSNMGVKSMMPYPVPEAGEITDHMQVVCTYLNPNDLTKIGNLRTVFEGKHLPDTTYSQVKKIRIEPRGHLPCEIDGDTMLEPSYEVSVSDKLRIITLPGKR